MRGGGREDVVVAWLWWGRASVMSHETALALHGLSDALPSKIHMSVPSTWAKRRLRVPAGVVITHRSVPKSEQAWVGPVPVTKAARTIEDCAIDDVNPELVTDALRQAKKRGLVDDAALQRLRSRSRERRRRVGSLDIDVAARHVK